jgi:hypothetical protein
MSVLNFNVTIVEIVNLLGNSTYKVISMGLLPRNAAWMIIIFVMFMAFTSLIRVVYSLKGFKDHCFFPAASKLRLTFQHASAWWLANIFGSFWVMVLQETQSVICILAHPPLSSCSLSLLFLLWSTKFFKPSYILRLPKSSDSRPASLW